MLGLALLNLFLADVQGGLGPFLATWLAGQAGWNTGQVGVLMTAAGIAGLLFSAPAGALVDRVPRPRLWLALGSAAIVAGTLSLLPARGFLPVLAAQVATAAGAAVMAPAMMALTLALVGIARFPGQQGRNQAWNHTGNVAAAALIAGCTFLVGPASAFAVLAGMAGCSGLTLLLFRGDSIDPVRASGAQAEQREPLPTVLGNRDVVVLSVVLLLFHLGNAAMLPLLGQRMAVLGRGDATRWLAICVVVAQMTMVPVAAVTGWASGRFNRAWLLAVPCLVLPVRGVLAALARDPAWLVPVQVLDACGAGTLGVIVPILVADFTWGGGRTQTAFGAVAMAQGIGAALSATLGGVLVQDFGWVAGFLGLAVPALAALGFAMHLIGAERRLAPAATQD